MLHIAFPLLRLLVLCSLLLFWNCGHITRLFQKRLKQLNPVEIFSTWWAPEFLRWKIVLILLCAGINICSRAYEQCREQWGTSMIWPEGILCSLMLEDNVASHEQADTTKRIFSFCSFCTNLIAESLYLLATNIQCRCFLSDII